MKDLFREMLRIRLFEELLLKLFGRGLIGGTVHTCLGQEGCAVGVIRALDQRIDSVCSNHRGHGHFLAFSGSFKSLLLEIMGNGQGICKGIGGSQHLHVENFYSNGILGGMMPVATGIALANKMQHSNAISVIFSGDGAMAEGVVYEALNMAALWELPLLLVIEHNKIAQSTPWQLEHSGPIEKKVEGFGIKTKVIDGNDVFAVMDATKKIVDEMRLNSKPQCLLLQTERLGPHSKGDDTRSKEAVEQAKLRDPILSLGDKLEAGAVEIIKKECQQEIDELLTDCGIAELC